MIEVAIYISIIWGAWQMPIRLEINFLGKVLKTLEYLNFEQYILIFDVFPLKNVTCGFVR